MPDLTHERRLYRRGLKTVAGVDEAGRGPLAGPVVAAAVVLPEGLTGEEDWLQALDDSKRLSARQRETAFQLIHDHAVAVAVVEETPAEIDRIGIGRAVIKAMLRAVNVCRCLPSTCCWITFPSRNAPTPLKPW